VEGCELHLSTHSLASLQADVDGAKSWDVVEVDLLPYMEKIAAGQKSDYVLIPVFLARQFQMRHFYIRTDRGIKQLADLRGKKIGVDGYGGTTPTWLRGSLQIRAHVKPEEMTWLDTRSSSAPVGSLSSWLADGTVDVIVSTDTPKAYSDKKPNVGRLFEDYRAIEQEWFRESRVFPIMTAVAVKQSLVKENPWLPEALFLAFSKAKAKAYADLTLPLPWGGDQLDETQKIMGKNFWSYGVKSNPKTLGAIFSFAESQGLLAKKLPFDDVFEPSTLELIEP
jgi:4,5-dihydroxyphthalate decarboxylase